MSETEADEIARLRAKIAELRATVARNEAQLARRNRELDALHMVWCNGGCPGGVHRYQGEDVLVTEELVAIAERNTKRLRGWYETVKHRLERWPTASEWHRQYAARAASRTDLT
jgi:hypothetical protein